MRPFLINIKYAILAIAIYLTAFPLFSKIAAATDFPMLGGNINRSGYISGSGPDSSKPYWIYTDWEWNKNVSPENQGTIASLAVIKGGRLFTITESGHLLSLDLKTKKENWLTRLDEQPEGIAADDKNVFVTMASAKNLAAFSQNDGKKVWQGEATKSMSHSLPLVTDKYLIVGDDGGFVNALDRGTGRIVWRKNLGEVIHSSAAFGEGLVFIGTEDNNSAVFALRIDSGETVWKFPIDKIGGRVNLFHGTPVYQDGKVYIGSENWYFYALSAKEGRLVWKKEFAGWFSSAAAIDSKNIYIGNWDGNFYALDKDNGSIVWKYNAEGDNPFGVSSTGPDGSPEKQGINSWPLATDNKIFFGTGNGYFYALDKKSGKLIWKEKYGHVWPILADEILIIPNHPPQDALGGEMIIALSNNSATDISNNSGPLKARVSLENFFQKKGVGTFITLWISAILILSILIFYFLKHRS